MNPAIYPLIVTPYFFFIVCMILSMKEKNKKTLVIFIIAFISWLAIFLTHTHYVLYPIKENKLSVYGSDELQNQIITFVPEEFIENLTRIIMIDKSYFKEGVAGEYHKSTKTIYIEKDSNVYFMAYLYHEIGHHIENNLMTENEIYEWRLLYNATGGVTDYGNTNEEEGFAELFACRYFPKNCKNIQRQNIFLDKIIKRIT